MSEKKRECKSKKCWYWQDGKCVSAWCPDDDYKLQPLQGRMNRMRIDLIDFDGKIPNLALMKLSAYHKSIGDINKAIDVGKYIAEKCNQFSFSIVSPSVNKYFTRVDYE